MAEVYRVLPDGTIVVTRIPGRPRKDTRVRALRNTRPRYRIFVITVEELLARERSTWRRYVDRYKWKRGFRWVKTKYTPYTPPKNEPSE